MPENFSGKGQSQSTHEITTREIVNPDGSIDIQQSINKVTTAAPISLEPGELSQALDDTDDELVGVIADSVGHASTTRHDAETTQVIVNGVTTNPTESLGNPPAAPNPEPVAAAETFTPRNAVALSALDCQLPLHFSDLPNLQPADLYSKVQTALLPTMRHYLVDAVIKRQESSPVVGVGPDHSAWIMSDIANKLTQLIDNNGLLEKARQQYSVTGPDHTNLRAELLRQATSAETVDSLLAILPDLLNNHPERGGVSTHLTLPQYLLWVGLVADHLRQEIALAQAGRKKPADIQELTSFLKETVSKNANAPDQDARWTYLKKYLHKVSETLALEFPPLTPEQAI